MDETERNGGEQGDDGNAFLVVGDKGGWDKEGKRRAGRTLPVIFLSHSIHKHRHAYMHGTTTDHQLGLLGRDGLPLGADSEGLQELQLPVLDLEVEAQPVVMLYV